MSNSVKDGVVALGGREFRRVKSGLDEAQVASFIDQLIRERDKLAQSQHHMASLTKLAETTIVEADRLANQIKAEATEQAKAESAAIIGKAKEQAQQIVDKKQAEVLKIANEEAAGIRAEAEKKAAALLEIQTGKTQDALRKAINEQFGFLLEELERLKQQAVRAQADFQNKLSPSAEPGSTMAVDSEEEACAATAGTQAENRSAIMELKAELGAEPVTEAKAPDQYPQLSQDTSEPDRAFDLSRLLEREDRAQLGEPQFEVEILPPVHMRKMMEVVAYLDELPEVENTEIIPRVDMPAILVFLREELNLLDVLRTIPGVAHIEEVSTGADASNGDLGQEPKKVRIGLSENTMLQEKQ
ncbi:MAG: hypothetical protein IBX67_01670 [Dehalococcoidia bacterium]|nr:hypothetical protein [Dehalococcoidia bacterium]